MNASFTSRLTTLGLLAVMAGSATLLACAHNVEEALNAPAAQSLISPPAESAYRTAQSKQLPEEGENLVRNKMLSLFLYALSN